MVWMTNEAFQAIISWDQVCSPQEEGGLGFCRIMESNKVTTVQHLGTQGQQCIWHKDVPVDASWRIRKELSISEEGHHLIPHRIGNGKGIFLWLHNCPGALYKRLRDN